MVPWGQPRAQPLTTPVFRCLTAHDRGNRISKILQFQLNLLSTNKSKILSPKRERKKKKKALNTMAAAQQQTLMEDFACFTDPQLKPGQGTITIGDLCVSPVTHARGGISSPSAGHAPTSDLRAGRRWCEPGARIRRRQSCRRSSRR